MLNIHSLFNSSRYCHCHDCVAVVKIYFIAVIVVIDRLTRPGGVDQVVAVAGALERIVNYLLTENLT